MAGGPALRVASAAGVLLLGEQEVDALDQGILLGARPGDGAEPGRREEHRRRDRQHRQEEAQAEVHGGTGSRR
jgi:hypothetical protein